jgi:GT2 family glycosyltransferase
VTSDRGLAALVVNYDTGGFAVRCLESLVREWVRGGRPRELLSFVVVENASPSDQSEHLERMEALGARIVTSEENLGYAGGMNLAYAHSRGAEQDVVALLNPDLYFLPGSVDTLMEGICADPRIGAVDPRACIDPFGVINLPPNMRPGLRDRFLVSAGHLSPWWSRTYSRMRHARALQWWSAEGPLESDMLSGCCLFLRRSVVEELGFLMDERYPLYFEDSDLFRRLRRRGYKLVHHGDAKILHHWARSTGSSGQFHGEPRRRYEISQRAYFRKYYGRLGTFFLDALEWVEGRWPKNKLHRPLHELVELGEFGADPVEIPLPRSCRYLLELAVDNAWSIACGIFGEGQRWVCPQEAWEWYFQGAYFMRGIDLDSGELLGAWHFTKSVIGRNRPIEDFELEAFGERTFGGKAV